MKKVWMTLTAMALAGSAMMALAQPKPKSQKEYDAYVAILQTPDPAARIPLADKFLASFADTELKAQVLQVATMSAFEANDPEKVIIYGERTLEADPKNYVAALMIARAIAYRTREFDLDKEDKLNRSEKLAKMAIEQLQTAQKPNPQIPDADWEVGKKDYTGQAHDALGMGAMIRKKYDVALTEFQKSLELSMQPNPDTMVFMADAYNNLGKYDEAIAMADKASADPNASAGTKQRAAAQKMKANQAKAKAAAPKP